MRDNDTINKKDFSIVKQCKLLEVSHSGLYYQPVKESAENLAIMNLMDEQYFKTPFYPAC